MELTRKRIDEVKFRTKGDWYSIQQVDAFLEEVAVGVEEFNREKAAQEAQITTLAQEKEQLAQEKEALTQEANRLQQQLADLEAAARQAPQEVAPSQVEAPEKVLEKPASKSPSPQEEEEARAHRAKVCEELERERDMLIEQIRTLRRFREKFRCQMEQDTQNFLTQLAHFPSDDML